jgi:hypothetical protein
VSGQCLTCKPGLKCGSLSESIFLFTVSIWSLIHAFFLIFSFFDLKEALLAFAVKQEIYFQHGILLSDLVVGNFWFGAQEFHWQFTTSIRRSSL